MKYTAPEMNIVMFETEEIMAASASTSVDVPVGPDQDYQED